MYEYYRRVHEQGHGHPLTVVAGSMWYGLMNPIKKAQFIIAPGDNRGNMFVIF